MFEAEFSCHPGGAGLMGAGSTPEAAFQDAAAYWEQACGVPPPGDQWSWTGSGEYWAPVTINGEQYGELRDTTGTPLPVGTFDYTIQPGGGGDPAYPGFTASEIATVFSWGFGAVVFFWFLGQCIGAVLGVIRRA